MIRRSMRCCVSTFACAMALLFLHQVPAAAVIIDSGDGTGNTTAPPDDPGWENVGSSSGFPVVYLRNGWILTAAHVGIGDVLLDSLVYTAVPGSDIQLDNGDGTFADLVLFSITPLPTVPDLTVRTNTSLPSGDIMLVGKGRDRGTASDTDDPGIWTPPPSNPTPAIEGWYWSSTSSSMRWGTNTVAGAWTLGAPDTKSFYTLFDDPASVNHTAHESQAANGDSGGAVFAQDGLDWELAGIMWAIATFSGQNPNTSALRGNVTVIADLSFYATDINAITATVPEPALLLQLLAGAGAIAALNQRRERKRPRA